MCDVTSSVSLMKLL